MSKNLEESGLKSIVSKYDLFFIDIWGVVHNGIKLYENAIKVFCNTLGHLHVLQKDQNIINNLSHLY